jgi:hypothetical protein
MAIGQFLLFPREEYWRIGGHKAVKSRVLEDIWLAVVVNQHGGRHIAVNLSSAYSGEIGHLLGVKPAGCSVKSATPI